MPRAILILSCALAWLAATGARAADAPRVAELRIAKVATAAATLRDVHVRLAWRAGEPAGELQLDAGAVDAPDVGYRWRDLRWRCPLSPTDEGGWRCEGAVRSGGARPLQLAVAIDGAGIAAALRDGRATLDVDRRNASPDDIVVALAHVPLAWAQALLAQAWPDGELKGGTLDGRLRVHAATGAPLRVAGTLALADAALDTPDASIAAQGVGARLDLDYRSAGSGATARSSVVVEGDVRGGELLFGNAYVALPPSPIGLHVEARKQGDAGWTLPAFEWRDGDVLHASGSAALTPDAGLQALDLTVHAADLAPWRQRYLSGWLGLAGLSELALEGGLDAELHVADGALQGAAASLHDIVVGDGKQRFRFDGLDGDLRFSTAAAPVDSALRWRGGKLYGLDFDAATLPLRSAGGALRLREPVTVPALGGTLRFGSLELRPPAGDAGLRMDFGLDVDRLDIGAIASALGLPAFAGELSGSIPAAHYADERLQFDGGLDMQLFGGTIHVSQLALERPFGVAPSLGADLALDDIDLRALTGVLDFGSIDGKLDGRIDGLRLVDWNATAFDADLHTDAAAAKRAGVRQRISQRAVQDISSVGDASFVASLQGRLIALFDDFGYRRIGISCRLANEVCAMDGLPPAAGRAPAAADTAGSSAGFTIVEGAGLPRLSVVGYHRLVDWPTLLERLAAAGSGEASPVVQ